MPPPRRRKKRGKWTPVRKIAAAAFGAVASFGGVGLWIAGDSELDWRALLAAAITATTPVVLGYLTPADAPPNDPRGL